MEVGFRNPTSNLSLPVWCDPIGYDGGINVYGYVGGDPVNFADPSGLDRIRVFIDKDGSKLGTHARLYIGVDNTHGDWYGFYPACGKKRRPTGDGKVYGRDDPGGRPGQWVDLEVTPEERRKIRRRIVDTENNPPHYDVGRYNCSTWVQDVLKAGDVEVGGANNTRTPDELLNGLQSDDHYLRHAGQ